MNFSNNVNINGSAPMGAGGVTIKWDRDALMARLIPACNKAVVAAAEIVAREAENLLTKGDRWAHSNPGNPPNFQTGELAGSITVVGPEALGRPLTAAVGTAVPHGRYMELGATIRPRNVKALPVPVNQQAEQMLQRIKGASLRTQKLITIKKDGKRYLVEKTPTGRVKKNGAVFALRTMVVIKPRPWLLPSLKLARDEMVERFKSVVQDELTYGGALEL